RSSVYGRFAVLPGSPGEALDFACAVMAKARDAKVALTIGVAQGPILPTTDALGGNIAGIAINQAARLAFLDSAHCFIAVEAPVAQQAFDDRTRPDWSFNPPIPQPPENRKVKQTELSFRSIKEISPEPPVSPADAPHELGARSENACVINVDIVKYSQNDLREMVVVAFRLLHEGLTHANQSTGGNPAPRGRYYAPGGDGGVFVYRDGEGGGLSEAWSFIKSLWDECRDSVAIRIGVAFQSVVLIDNEYPVGKGVLVADKLSAEAQIDAICSDREFWEHDLIKPKRRSWQQTEHLAESGVMAYLVSDRCTPVVPKPIEVQQWVEKHRQRIEETLLGFCDTALLREIFEALHPNEPTEGDQGKLARRVASTLTSEPGLQRNGPIGHLNALRRRWTVSQRTLEMERLRLVLDYTLPIRIHRATARDIVRQWRAGAKIIVGTATAWGASPS
ncbi:MAG: hypothetical protein NT069_18030, partial [Planctomycetota bacterium]|nr:hypothetical protein [Planctomycetota bacterium]